MKLVNASARFFPFNGKELLKQIEVAGRTCYKSENCITDESAEAFVKMLLERGHEAMIEHASLTAKVICDRGVTHEIVRHRIASYAQESTRYCNYSQDKFGNELAFVLPCWFKQPLTFYQDVIGGTSDCRGLCPAEYEWLNAMNNAEVQYLQLINLGWKPQQARSVLPHSLKAEIIVTMNLREWRHLFKLRCASAAHPQMREVAFLLYRQLEEELPILIQDIQIE